MEYKQVKYIMEENEQLKAEIERLKEALGEIQSYIGNVGNIPPIVATGYLQNVVRVVENALGNQQPEAPQESLKVRILRVLAMAADNDVHRVAINRMVNEDARLVDAEIAELDFCQLIDTTDSGWQLTAAGRDHLASLDKPTIETTEDYLSQLDNQQQEPLEITLLKALAKDGHQNAMSYHDICDCVGGAFASKALDDLRINRYITKAPRSRGEVQRYLITTKGRQHLEDSSKSE